MLEIHHAPCHAPLGWRRHNRDSARSGRWLDSLIAAIEFGDPVQARVLMTYGNASQPDSPHFGDQLVPTARAELRPAWLTRVEIEQHLKEHVVFSSCFGDT